MPNPVRKLIISAAVDGLLLRPEERSESQKSFLVKFKDKSITSQAKVEPDSSEEQSCLESHGIIGLLTVASYSFLICITRREQVALVFNKPIYVIKDIAILPLSSQSEASRVIAQAQADVQRARLVDEDDGASSTSGATDDEDDDHRSITELPGSPSPPSPGTEKAASDNQTSVMRDVVGTRSQYGEFASQWFSKRGWFLNSNRSKRLSTEGVSNLLHDANESKPNNTAAGSCDNTPTDHAQATPEYTASVNSTPGDDMSYPAATEMLPKTLRTTKILLTSRSFYFSYEFDITKMSGSAPVPSLGRVLPENLEQQFFWNRQLAAPFFNAGLSPAILPIMQGFIGQQQFVVKLTSNGERRTELLEVSGTASGSDAAVLKSNQSLESPEGCRSYLLTLISRKSVNRSGLRYLRRGIDDEGNCANTVETEQILSSPTWDPSGRIRSFVQLRASIPLYFSQSPYAFKPVPILHRAPDVNRRAFKRHFQELQARYGDVHAVLLVDQQGGERQIGNQYESLTKSFNKKLGIPKVKFEWFDFHRECRGMKFENIGKLTSLLEDTLTSFGQTEIDDQVLRNTQSGIVRTNCMDCLDRTNVVQSALAQHVLQKNLEADGFEVDFIHDTSTQWFNSLWADNGDAISRQYASTAALKGDFTRTRKRNYRGALNDFGLTVTRYYNNIVNDYFSQAVIDLLLGNVNSRIFEDFEATMMSADPGISIDTIRQNAINTCTKAVVVDIDEEMIRGLVMLVPAQMDTLRTMPFEEAVVLLTNRAVYVCRLDWKTEKIASFERIDHGCITKIHHGIYITSTLTEGQTDGELNAGLAITYKPGAETIKRVNTRSLRVSEDPKNSGTDADNKESIIMSWLRARNTEATHCMAMKVIPQRSLPDHNLHGRPRDTAKEISQDIKQAVGNSLGSSRADELDLVAQSDIISLEDARRRTGYLEQIGHSIKKLVWT